MTMLHVAAAIRLKSEDKSISLFAMGLLNNESRFLCEGNRGTRRSEREDREKGKAAKATLFFLLVCVLVERS